MSLLCLVDLFYAIETFFQKKKKEYLLLSPVMLSFLQCGWFSSLIIALTQQCFISFSWMTKCFVQMVMHVRSETSSAASLLAHNGIGGEWWQCLGIILKLPEGYMIANCLELKESVFVFNCCLIEKKKTGLTGSLAARHITVKQTFFNKPALLFFTSHSWRYICAVTDGHFSTAVAMVTPSLSPNLESGCDFTRWPPTQTW